MQKPKKQKEYTRTQKSKMPSRKLIIAKICGECSRMYTKIYVIKIIE